MDASKFPKPQTLHAKAAWHDACWLRQARAERARNVARSIGKAMTRFRAWRVCKFRGPGAVSAWLSFE
jgi:hypothetical protein